MKTIANGFAADLPPGWDDRTLTTWIGPTGPSGFAPNVVVLRQPTPGEIGLVSFAQSQLQATRAEFQDLEVLAERITKLGGFEALERLQRFSAGGRILKQSQSFIVRGNMAWVLTCSAQLEEFESNAPAFEKVVRSLRFFDPESAVV